MRRAVREDEEPVAIEEDMIMWRMFTRDGATQEEFLYSSLVHDDEPPITKARCWSQRGRRQPPLRRCCEGPAERSGLSPQELAEQADVHVSFVRGIERGAQAPSVTTARPLLACMKEQDRIQWMDSGPYDLLVRDPDIGRDVAFEFKAKVKGQNRRTDLIFRAPALGRVGGIEFDPAAMTASFGPSVRGSCRR